MNKIKTFLQKKIKQYFIKNEINVLSIKTHGGIFMDGSKNKPFAIYNPLKTVYFCMEEVYGETNVLNIHGITVDTQKENIDVEIFTTRPGILIGRFGKDIDKLTMRLSFMFDKNVRINIKELKNDINLPFDFNYYSLT